MSKILETLNNPFKKEKSRTSAQEEIAKIYLKVSDKNKLKNQRPAPKFPWVIAVMRYDVVNSPTDFQNGISLRDSRNRFSPGIQFLVRANLKIVFEYQHRWQQPFGGGYFRPNGAVGGIDYSF